MAGSSGSPLVSPSQGPAAPSSSELFAAVDTLVDARRHLDAIELLTAGNRIQRSAAVERRLVRLRHEAFAEVEQSPCADKWPRQLFDPFPGSKGLIELPADQLTSDQFGGTILHHGCLLVRNLLSHAAATRLVGDIDRAFEARARWLEQLASANDRRYEDVTGWFEPFVPDRRYGVADLTPARRNDDVYRVAVADSPAAMFNIVEAFETGSVQRLVSDYLGQRPSLTMNKWAMRRLPHKERFLGWHQEAAVFRQPVRAVNFWIALTECGRDSSGIEVVPTRINQVLDTAGRKYVVGDETIRALGDIAPVAPLFGPGDALVFDDMLLHRTTMPAGMTGTRYSIEAWFLTPDTCPFEQGPILL